MRVVLLDNIRGIGQVGDVKDVSDGYARNFLFPRKAAKPATQEVLKEVASLKAHKLQSRSLAREQAVELATKLTGTKLELSGKANEQGTLFAGIEPHHIAQSLSMAAGVRINADAVKLSEHIKTVGEHIVPIELAEGIMVSITVVVSPEH